MSVKPEGAARAVREQASAKAPITNQCHAERLFIALFSSNAVYARNPI
jgi:hypothetical protein